MLNHPWGSPVPLPDGRRLFEGHFNRWAIADDSGATPEQTDDGILWLDFQRSLKVERNIFEGKEYLHIPLLNDAGEQKSAITDAATLLRLATLFDWKIANEVGTLYKVLDD